MWAVSTGPKGNADGGFSFSFVFFFFVLHNTPLFAFVLPEILFLICRDRVWVQAYSSPGILRHTSEIMAGSILD